MEIGGSEGFGYLGVLELVLIMIWRRKRAGFFFHVDRVYIYANHNVYRFVLCFVSIFTLSKQYEGLSLDKFWRRGERKSGGFFTSDIWFFTVRSLCIKKIGKITSFQARYTYTIRCSCLI